MEIPLTPLEFARRARRLYADREAVVQDGRREADRILERARAESDRLVSEHEVYLAAVDEAGALTRQAMQETARMRKETDDYIDAKLATFEITLQKTLQTVDRGRERLRSQMYQELAPIQDQPYDDSFADTGFIDTGFIDDRR